VRILSQLVFVDSVGPDEYFGHSYPVSNKIRYGRVFDRPFASATDRLRTFPSTGLFQLTI